MARVGRHQEQREHGRVSALQPQGAAGQVTVVAGTGVTIDYSDSLKTRTQESMIGLKQIQVNKFELFGDAEPVAPARSALIRSANSVGAPAFVAPTADGQVLKRSSGTLVFGALTAAETTFTPYSTLAATNVQDAIEELLDEAGAGGGAWSAVKKTSNQVRSANTTLTDDSELTITLSASTTYHIRGCIFYEIANTTMGYKFGFNYTGTTSKIIQHTNLMGAAAAEGTDNVVSLTKGSLTATRALTPTAAGYGVVKFETVITTSTSGAFSFQWAQNTSNASNATVHSGSYFEYITI